MFSGLILISGIINLMVGGKERDMVKDFWTSLVSFKVTVMLVVALNL